MRHNSKLKTLIMASILSVVIAITLTAPVFAQQISVGEKEALRKVLINMDTLSPAVKDRIELWVALRSEARQSATEQFKMMRLIRAGAPDDALTPAEWRSLYLFVASFYYYIYGTPIYNVDIPVPQQDTGVINNIADNDNDVGVGGGNDADDISFSTSLAGNDISISGGLGSGSIGIGISVNDIGFSIGSNGGGSGDRGGGSGSGK